MTRLPDDLYPGRFRGIDVLVQARELSGARRVVLHEYAGVDGATVEDAGLAPEGFAVTFVVAGADVHDRRNELLAALRIGAAASYTDPWVGTLNVVVRSYRLREVWTERRVCVFEVDLVQDAAFVELPPAQRAPTPGFALEALLDAADNAAADAVAAIRMAGQPLRVVTKTLNRVKAAFALIVTRLTSAMTSVRRDLAELSSALDISGWFDDVGDADTLAAMAADYGTVSSDPPAPVGVAVLDAEAANEWAIDRYFAQALAIAAARAALNAPPDDRAAALAQRDTITALLRDAALYDAAAVFFGAMTGIADGLPVEIVIDPARPTNALALCHEQYGGVENIEAVLARNVAEAGHPGFWFVPVTVLRP